MIQPKASLVGIRIRWDDQNGFEEGFRVYRSPYPFDVDTLPPVLATLPPDTTEYIDEDVIIGIEYHYMISTFYRSHEAFATGLFSIIAKAGPDTIGEYYQGGYYIGNIVIPSGFDEGTYAVLMGGPATQQILQWKTANNDTPGTSSTVDGMANTLAMIAAGPELHPAANYCANLEHETFSDFYLPSKDEFYLAYTNRAALAALGLEAQNSWTSTQYSASNAWYLQPVSGSQNITSKSNSYRVRPVRRLKLMI